MAITVKERPLGRSFSSNGAEIGYVVFCSDGESEEELEAAVLAEAPESYKGFSRGAISAQEINFDADGDPSMWDVIVPYGTRGGRLIPPPTGTIQWSGTTAGGTQHIKTPPDTAEATTVFSAPSAPAVDPDDGAVIGMVDGEIKGAEIVVPVKSFRATMYVAEDDWPALDAITIQLTGRVNNQVWQADKSIYQPGEVLFLGATHEKRTDVEPNDYAVTFEFAAKPTGLNVKIGKGADAITVTSHGGWDYLDIRYERKEGGSDIFQRPKRVFVHQVYRSGNFGALGL